MEPGELDRRIGLVLEPDRRDALPAALCQIRAQLIIAQCGGLLETLTRLEEAERLLHQLHQLRPGEDWHEDLGNVLWWWLPIREPPYVGTPLDSNWPGYHTMWSPLPSCRAVADDMQHQRQVRRQRQMLKPSRQDALPAAQRQAAGHDDRRAP